MQSPPRWLGLWSVLGVLFLSGIVLKAYWPAAGMYDVTGYLIGRDFVNIWHTARLTWLGDPALSYDLSTYIASMRQVLGIGFPFHNWSYPPTILPFILPFGWLDYPVALFLWSSMGLLAYGLAAYPKNTPLWCGGFLLLLLTSPAAMVNLLSGQNGFFTAALFLGGWSCLNRRPILAGILFGLLTFKPHLGLLIPVALLLLGQWRTIAAASTTTVALAALSLALWGVDPWQNYFAHTLPYQHELLAVFKGFYTAMMPGTYAAARVVGLPMSPAILLHGLAALMAILAAYSILIRDGASPRAILGLAIATLLVTPYGYHYDLTLVAGALLTYVWTTPARAANRLVWGLVWLLPAATYAIMFAYLPLAPVISLAALVLLTYQACHRPWGALRMRAYTPSLAPYFDQYNRAWIAQYFTVELIDDVMLTQPESAIIQKGGEIWFAEQQGEIVATAALLDSGAGIMEFSKLGVAEHAKGRGISRKLLHHCIQRARLRGAHTLRIFTNSSLKTACALYLAEGFQQHPIPPDERERYQRADTYFLLRL